MRLAEWIDSQPYGEMARLARVTGLVFGTIQYLREGRHIPSYPTARLISDATGGAVTLDDLFGVPPKPAKRARKRSSRARVPQPQKSKARGTRAARAAAAA
jgi:hypothetical protein